MSDKFLFCPKCGYKKDWSLFRERCNLELLYCPECFKMIPNKEWLRNIEVKNE